LRQDDLDRFLLDKYGNYDTLFNGVHHYETVEIKDTNKVTILPAGMQVDSDFSISYFDQNLGNVVTSSNVKEEVTNYQYEDDLQTDKRNLFLLKPRYLNLVLDDLEDMMLYKKGSTQYKSETLKTAEDIRIYN
jgi:hypothetical protein